MGLRELMYLVFGIAMVNGVIGNVAVNRFLARKKSISVATDLASFKVLARQQMYQALVQMVLLIGGCIIGVYGLITGKIGLLLVLVLNGLVLAMGLVSKGAEKKARALPVDDPSLRAEYAHVCESWVHKPFPDF